MHQLAKRIDVRPDTVSRWLRKLASPPEEGRTGYIRLDVLFQLAALRDDREFCLREIEKQVSGIKGYGCSLPAFGVRFPLVEGRSMIHLLIHFMGDGFIHPIVGSDKSSCYTNLNEHLRTSLRYHANRGRVAICGKTLKRKKAAAQWMLTDLGKNWILTLRSVNENRNQTFMREMLTHRDYVRYRYTKRS